MALIKRECMAKWTANGTGVANAYGSDYVSSNSVSRKFYVNEEGDLWSTTSNLSRIKISVYTALGGTSVTIGNSYAVSYTCQLTCNGKTITLPTGTITSDGYKGTDGTTPADPYIGFTWGKDPWHENSNLAVGGYITDTTFLTGIKNKADITIKFTSLSKGYIIKNAYLVINEWCENIPPGTPSCVYPVAGTTTYNTKPRFRMRAKSADGKSLDYQYSFNGVDYFTFAENIASNATKTGQADEAHSIGTKTFRLRAYDGIDYSNPILKFQFNIGATSLGASKGSEIDDTIIDNAQSYIENLYAYYNCAQLEIPEFTWTTYNKGSKLTKASLDELNTNLKALPPAKSFTVPAKGTAISASTFATDINNAIKNS